MNLMEVVMAALVLMLGTSAAARLWGEALRASGDLAQREERLHNLEALLLASEGKARAWATNLTTTGACPEVAERLESQLRELPATPGAILTLPPSPSGVLHVRWEAGGLRRERLLSVSALGLCREGGHGP
ncbi:MAG: hypothetical protein ACK41W_06025 [Cyanobacteriota bacterium]|jgi:hypothetical protein